MSAHGHNHSATTSTKRRLTAALALAAAYLVAEVIGGLWSGSLALLADAGHMLTDVGGLGLALLALRFSERPATPDRTYGYYRGEILAALANAIVLVLISLYVLYEAYKRFQAPPEVASGIVLIVASIGLVVNVAVSFFSALVRATV
jgi:cobalt-zinc-cadmium efflux system protein